MTTPRPPAPLPRSTRAMLAAYRDAHELPEAARDRIWSVVGDEDAPAPTLDADERPKSASYPAAARPRSARWLGWGMGALAAAAVLLLAWQLGGTLAERRRATRTPGAAVMQGDGGAAQGHARPRASRSTAPSGTEPAPPGTEPVPAPSTVEPTAAPSTPLDSSPAPSSPRGAPARPRRADAATPEPTSTLAAERELVAEAWRALALGETDRALDTAAEHARRFPAGLLSPERAAIETIARCRRGDADGPHRATAFHRAHPRSPLAERVDEACAAPSPKSITTP